mmetsp:Transcript_28772/g.43543  ORF Transcript_28772/g.43543 Transcript_28772/m.43543 type:complete len:149 (-) Transcript_28772:708-1154(-)|eukprot:CAMPEP_0194759760 /NCGR_PEP_ID=MMETSP0323_2-20130528/12772_1 /TAXON_ID=2866 ORGANISM="Crypthecodinium cohnii, Strain Seligo" /NCGR_SAMPLE_ID=MMETSP0323_2 /ASSEMBLY_ACC=CAM_ASM_000346 /LENGTH=148 /DNA_ID=CAMNT_0039680677 /DNA_START=174 /DNA_END=620 /DNA_ORIENTATION=-
MQRQRESLATPFPAKTLKSSAVDNTDITETKRTKGRGCNAPASKHRMREVLHQTFLSTCIACLVLEVNGSCASNACLGQHATFHSKWNKEAWDKESTCLPGSGKSELQEQEHARQDTPGSDFRVESSNKNKKNNTSLDEGQFLVANRN